MSRSSWRVVRTLVQLAIAAAFLVAWQFLPMLEPLSKNVRLFDPFFISSPAQVWQNLSDLATGNNAGHVTIWPYLWTTVYSALLGTAIGMLLGAVFGLVFSNSQRLSEVVRPFIILANTVPRVAIIPIIVVLAGANVSASIISVIAVVFFLGFFNAFEGGQSVRGPMLENAKLLGASQLDVMREVRLPMVLTWVFAAVPNAISFGLIVAVTTELLAGIPGMGALLQSATTNVQAGLTFAIIVALAVVGLLMYWGAVALKRAVMRWEP